MDNRVTEVVRLQCSDMTSEASAASKHHDASDVMLCVGFVLMSLGITTLAAAYLFTGDLADKPTSSLNHSARESEAAELRAWTVFTICWTAGLCLVAVGVIVITGTFVYSSYCCQHPTVTSSHAGDVIALSALQSRASYGTSDEMK